MRIFLFLFYFFSFQTVLNGEIEYLHHTNSTAGQFENEEIGKEKEKKSSPHQMSRTVAFLSDYCSRGISQTIRQPAVQGEFKYTHASGFYFKNWASNIDGTGNLINNSSLEWDIYLGFKHSLFQTKAIYNIGFLYYYYPGGKARVPANTRYDTLEYYFAVEYKKLEFKLSLTVTDYFANNSSNPPMNWNKLKPVRPNGSSFGSPYLEINYEYPFYPKWKVAFHIGYQGVINYPQLNYVDWLVNLTREFEWFEVTLSYIQTNARKAFYRILNHAYHPHRVDLGGPTVVVAVDKTF